MFARLGIIGAMCAAIGNPAGGPPPVRSAAVTDAAVSLWYRGTPAGVPQADDLAVIRAVGFTAVTWPTTSADGAVQLRRLSDMVGLDVNVRLEPAPLRLADALRPAERIDVRVADHPPALLPALLWRAIAHGARLISIDPGQSTGTGLNGPNGGSPAWLPPVVAVARQVAGSSRLIAEMTDGPPAVIEGARPAGVDVALLDGRRAWVVIATNTVAVPARLVVDLPRDVRYALWVSLIDGSPLSMLSRPAAGPQWAATLGPYGVGVYVIDK